MQGRAVRRPSLPLTMEDEASLAELKASPELLSSLSNLLDIDIDLASSTESALLHALLQAGIASVRSAAMEAGYAELARQNRTDVEQRRATARRRRPTWADER